MLQPRGTITFPRPCIHPAGRTRRGSAAPPITRVRSGGLQIGLKGKTDQYFALRKISISGTYGVEAPDSTCNLLQPCIHYPLAA